MTGMRRNRMNIAVLCAAVIVLTLIWGCVPTEQTIGEHATQTPELQYTPEPTVTNTPVSTFVQITASPRPTAPPRTPVPTAEPTPTPVPTPSATRTPRPTATPIPADTDPTGEPSQTPEDTAEPLPTDTEPPVPETETPIPVQTDLQRQYTMETDMLELVNQARQAQGLAALAMNEVLRDGAYGYSVRMATEQFFDHVSPDGGTMLGRFSDLPLQWTLAGENIAMGNVTLAEFHMGLMDSPGHRENILGPEYTVIGIGVTFDPVSGNTYITQWFAKLQ